jgi:BASS family bile acid:Na+ symporter
MTLVQLIPIAISVSIFLVVFTLGLDADFRDATYLFRRPALLFRSILSMNVIMVLFAVAMTALVDLDHAIQIVLVVLAVSPVPPILPRKQMKMGGTESYAIGLLVAAVLLSIIVVPASIELLGRYFEVDAHMPLGRLAPVVLISAIVPLIAGILFRRLAPDFADKIAKPLSLGAILLLVLAVLPILFTTSDSIWNLVGRGGLVVMALFTLVGLAVGHILGGPEPDNRTDLALATCARHPGIALAIATLNFPDRKAEVMALIICHLIIGAVVAIPYNIWRKRSHAARETGPAR